MSELLYRTIDLIITALVGLAGIIGVIYTAKKSTVAALSSTYLSEMISTYSDFISAVNNFVYHSDDLEQRDRLSATLLRLQLFAPDELNSLAQVLYTDLLKWGSTPQSECKEIDYQLQTIQKHMVSDIEKVRKTGDHQSPPKASVRLWKMLRTVSRRLAH